VLSPQFCSISRQGVRCRLATAAEAGTAVEIPTALISRMSLEDVLLNKLVVIKVLSVIDDDTCRVTLPVCEQNQQQIPQLARSLPLLSLTLLLLACQLVLSFRYAAPTVWNSITFNIRHSPSIGAFKRHLKMYLFTLPG